MTDEAIKALQESFDKRFDDLKNCIVYGNPKDDVKGLIACGIPEKEAQSMIDKCRRRAWNQFWNRYKQIMDDETETPAFTRIFNAGFYTMRNCVVYGCAALPGLAKYGGLNERDAHEAVESCRGIIRGACLEELTRINAGEAMDITTAMQRVYDIDRADALALADCLDSIDNAEQLEKIKENLQIWRKRL